MKIIKLSTALLTFFIIFSSCQRNKLTTSDSAYSYQNHQQKLQYLNTKDGKMAYLDVGKGPVILLVHGVPTSSWLYRKITPILVKKGYRVIAPDLLGYGASEKPTNPELYTTDKMGQRLLKLMDHLQINEWSQVFHDGGGLWTWEMLKIDASKVKQLIMLNTIVYESGFKPPLRFQEGAVAKTYAKQYSNKLGQKMVINPTFKNGIKNHDVINQTMLEGYKVPFLGQGHDALYYFFTRTCNNIPDYSGLHKSLNIPLTVIWGKEDDMLVWDGIKEQTKINFNLKDENIHILDAKHFIQEEKPTQIAEIIIKSMNSIIE